VKAVLAIADKAIPASAKSAQKRVALQPADQPRPRSWDREWWIIRRGKLITAGQRMGNTTFKTNQRQPTTTRDENPVN
jgi:hypothetical protein